jgi:hypothetical protein
MAQHNTDYGLVYDDEGKICVTKRTDIIPFSGVTSYAVETGTTNLIGHTNGRFNTVTGAGTTPPTVTLVDMKTPWGSQAWKVTIPANNATGWSGCRIYTNSFQRVQGNYYSYFTYIMFEGNFSASDVTITYGGHGYDMPHMVHDANKDFNGWQYFSKENQMSNYTGGCYLFVTLGTTSTVARTFYIAVGQFEQKPFASSFVNGTRPNGRLVRPLNLLGFNPATDDWVVHYWKYPVATNANNLNGYNSIVIGKYTSDRSQGYIWWGKIGDENKFNLTTDLSNNTRVNYVSPIFDPTWYFRKWHHEVMLKHGNELQYWVDGILQVQASLTNTLNSNFTLGMSIGGDENGNPHNSYIANIAYGLYTPQWTPEYIQRISAMTSTFYVPTKRVIV